MKTIKFLFSDLNQDERQITWWFSYSNRRSNVFNVAHQHGQTSCKRFKHYRHASSLCKETRTI
jgi:hypothetical protein